jgi:hypothetical protein
VSQPGDAPENSSSFRERSGDGTLTTDVLDTIMITSLAELLEEKGVITQEEWEQKIQKNPKV